MSAYSGNDIFSPEERGSGSVPLIRERNITFALAAKAGEVCSKDGATYAAEFLVNLDIEHLNAIAHALYTTNTAFRELFDSQYRETIYDQLTGDFHEHLTHY